MLEQGPDYWCWFDTTQFSYIPLCSPNTCKYVFNPNVTAFQSNCAEGLHFSAFIIFCFCFFYFFYSLINIYHFSLFSVLFINFISVNVFIYFINKKKYIYIYI